MISEVDWTNQDTTKLFESQVAAPLLVGQEQGAPGPGAVNSPTQGAQKPEAVPTGG